MAGLRKKKNNVREIFKCCIITWYSSCYMFINRIIYSNKKIGGKNNERK